MGYTADIGNVLGLSQAQSKVEKYGKKTNGGKSLDMTDYLTLMVEMLKNQDMDNTADTSEMMSQMVQMSVVQAITEITNVINESTSLNYAASLVGKEVTVGQYEGKTLHEIVGTVTATGTLNGKQVIFIGDESYYLTDVMAIGRLPEKVEDALPDSDKTSDPDSDSKSESKSL